MECGDAALVKDVVLAYLQDQASPLEVQVAVVIDAIDALVADLVPEEPEAPVNATCPTTNIFLVSEWTVPL